MTAAYELVGEVERLLEDVESLADPVARQTAMGVVQALLELYGAGLERIVEAVSSSEAAGSLAREFAEDELVSHLLLVHGLHPVPVADRVLDALGEVRPYLESHGGDVTLLGVEGSTVRLSLQGSCSGCPSSTMTLKLAIENAIQKAAPEIVSVVAVEAEPSGPLLQIELAAPAVSGEWMTVGAIRDDGPLVREVVGVAVLFLRANGRLLAYRSSCPACGSSLADAVVRGTTLRCQSCADQYDVLRAGRGLDHPELHLDPVPLLEGEDGLVRVALPVAV